MPRSTESRAPIVPIIGGGPAGMSCALWLHNYGLNPVIIEKEGALGGMARLSPYPNAWLLGQRGKSGRENAAEFADHMRELAVETWLRARPQRLRWEHDARFRLEVSGTPAARSLSSPAIVIATGTRFAGEDWLDRVENARRVVAAGRLHLGAAAVGEPGVDLGSHVAVIGGGDNAFDVSRMLAEKGVRVTVVMRARSRRWTTPLPESACACRAAARSRPTMWFCYSAIGPIRTNPGSPSLRLRPTRSAISQSTATWRRPVAACSRWATWPIRRIHASRPRSEAARLPRERSRSGWRATARAHPEGLGQYPFGSTCPLPVIPAQAGIHNHRPLWDSGSPRRERRGVPLLGRADVSTAN